MTPEVDQILGQTAGQLMMEVVPLLPASYAQSSAGLLAIILGFCAQEFDRAADIRAAENADIRKLFAELSPAIGDAGLKKDLESAGAGKDGSLKISDLNAANAELRRLLIVLQTHVEDHGPKHACAKICKVLAAGAERRMLKLPGA